MHGFHGAIGKPGKPRVRRLKTPEEPSGTGMVRARQDKPENLYAWTGIFVTSLGEIPAGCICDWIYHNGVLEIKYPNAICPLQHKR